MANFGGQPNRYAMQDMNRRGRNMGRPEPGGGGFNTSRGVTYGAPAPAPPPQQQAPASRFAIPDFGGLDMGGGVQNGDLRFDNPNAAPFYDSYNRTFGDIATSEIGADASKFGSSAQRESSMFDSLMRFLGIESQTGSSDYATDASERVAMGAQGVDRYGIDTNADVSRDQFENQYNIADITSGRSLEGEKYGVDGRTDVANIQANSARDVADLQNLRYKLENEQFGTKMDAYNEAFARFAGGGRGLGGAAPSSANLETLDPSEALNSAYAANARQNAATMNGAGGAGSSPQAGALSQRADLQEAMANQAARTDIIPSYANANNQNRLAELAALAEQRRAATQDRDGLLGFLSALV